MVARGAGAAGPVLLACRQWDPLGLARRLPSLGVGAWRCAPLLPWRVQCPVCVCAALAAGSGGVQAGTWCCVSPVSPFPPRVFRAACGGPSRPGVPYPRSLVPHSMRSVRSARSVRLPLRSSPRVLFVFVRSRSRGVRPPPRWVVWRAHLAWSRHWALVGPFHVVRAPPRVLPRSRAPSGVLGGGAVRSRFPPTWLGVVGAAAPGRPSSGAGSQGPASRVSRVRSTRACGASTGPTACAFAGWRCSLWGWRKGVPGGGAFRRCEGRLVSGAVPPPTARPPARAARVPRPVCPGCGRCGRMDPAPAPQRAPLRAGVARCGGGGRASPGGVPSTVVRGAWCQALSLPRPPVLWSGQPGFRDPCVQGAVDAGVWTQHRPHSVRPCGPALLAVGVAEGRPRGGCLPPCCEGRLVSGAVPPPTARPLERAAGVPRPACPGCGRRGRVSPAPAPQRAPLRAGVARCGGGGRASPGGVPSTVVWGAWCQALSLPRPPVLWSGQPGSRVPRVPGAVDAGVWTQHRPHSVRPCGPALLAVGVAEGRPRGGCLPPL